jgi:hypothetical protein
MTDTELGARALANLAHTLTDLGCAATLADPELLRMARIIEPTAFAIVGHPDHDQHFHPVTGRYARRLQDACAAADRIAAGRGPDLQQQDA